MALPRYDGAVFDNVPRPVPGASIYVYLQPTNPSPITPANWNPATASPLAAIYVDNGGITPLANPFQADGTGNYFFYAAGGTYTIVLNGGTLAAPVVMIDQSLGTGIVGITLEHNGVLNSTQTLLNLVQGTNTTITESGGSVTISSGASPITLQTNGVNNPSQTTLNLQQGTNITLAASGGTVTITAASAPTFKTNGSTNTVQNILNLIAGANMTLTADGAGGVTFVAATPTFQSNGTNLTTQTPVNFQSTSNITVGNPSAGNVSFTLSNVTDAVKVVQTTIATAAVKTLRATPVQLLAAPGANLQFVPSKVAFEFVPATTPYATVSTADLAVYADSTKASAYKGDSTGLLDQSAKTYEQVAATTTKFFTTDAHSTNQPLMLANVAGAEYTAGDGSLVVTVYYTVLSTT